MFGMAARKHRPGATDHLFVYGTLRPKAPRPLGEAQHVMQLLECVGEYVGRAKLRGRLYKVEWYPALRESSDPGDVVIGDVFRIPRESEIFAVLDKYEDASAKPSVRCEYRRRKKFVTLSDGRRVLAWTYIYNRVVDPTARIVGGDFLRAASRRRQSHAAKRLARS
jgi:gamma-glutamylcyclotransferase (GGCT)/AIG2-like uncharacterized protein YtfP